MRSAAVQRDGDDRRAFGAQQAPEQSARKLPLGSGIRRTGAGKCCVERRVARSWRCEAGGLLRPLRTLGVRPLWPSRKKWTAHAGARGRTNEARRTWFDVRRLLPWEGESASPAIDGSRSLDSMRDKQIEQPRERLIVARTVLGRAADGKNKSRRSRRSDNPLPGPPFGSVAQAAASSKDRVREAQTRSADASRRRASPLILLGKYRQGIVLEAKGQTRPQCKSV